jgi:glycine/D-amino acid oxidase-like deaminating enzyme
MNPTGFKPVGFIEVACEKDRLEEYRRVSAFNRLCGVDVHEISASEVKKLFPLARVDDILAGFYVKEDGRVNPVDVTMALGKGARLHGARVFEGVPVTGILRKKNRATGVRRPYGGIEAASTARACGPASSATRSASTSRTRPPSTTT